MSLSQENIDKLHLNGIYQCDPVLEWIESFRRNDPYHCINWTFTVFQSNSGKFYMRDTYWASGGLHVELNDENFDKFEFLFDRDEVVAVPPSRGFYDYDEKDRWHLALDSGGMQYSKYYYVRKGAEKNKEYQIQNLQHKLDSLTWELKKTQSDIDEVVAELNKLKGE